MMENKNTIHYLDNSINLHCDEKSQQMTQAISARHEGAVVVEIGPGGGAALMGVCDQNIQRGDQQLKDIHITTVELFSSQSSTLIEASQRLQEQGATVNHIQGNATNLPFADKSVDIINCSSVLHEVFSYEGGRTALVKTLQEIKRITKPGADLLYRDVYPVETSLLTPIKQRYDQPSWIEFVNRFIPYYLKDNNLYTKSSVDISEHEGVLLANIPAGLAREVQRHYITFRDQLIRSGILGTKIDTDRYDETEWVRCANGFEKKIYLLQQNGNSLLAHDLPVQEDRTGIFVPASDFDQFIDNQLARFFKALQRKDPEVEAIYDSWLKREGHESYIYGSVSEVTDMLRTSGQGCNDEEHFTITSPGAYTIAERDYYTSYLKRVLGEYALPDRKLIISLVKK